MKIYNKRVISQVSVPKAKKLITCRNIHEEMLDEQCKTHDSLNSRQQEDLRHFGCCQRITIVDYTGNDYTQDSGIPGDSQKQSNKKVVASQVFVDLKYASKVRLVDLTGFDRNPGCTIRIMPRESIRFVKVTVRICDLFNQELVHGHAWDLDGTQEWIFTYHPKQRLCPEPANLLITICASEKPRLQHEPMVDLYELPPEKLREKMLHMN